MKVKLSILLCSMLALLLGLRYLRLHSRALRVLLLAAGLALCVVPGVRLVRARPAAAGPRGMLWGMPWSSWGKSGSLPGTGRRGLQRMN